MAFNLWIAVLVAAATACVIKANVIFYQILDELNAKRPPDRQISFLFVNAKTFEVLREHAGFYPSSPKRKSMGIWAGLGFALFLLIVLSAFLHA